MYQAGTLAGNPVAMAAGLAQLRYLNDHPQVYEKINASAQKLAEGMRQAARQTGAPVVINQICSLAAPFFTADTVESFSGAKRDDLNKYAEYFGRMLDSGIYLAPAQFEAMFVSAAHTDADIQHTIETVQTVFSAMF